MRTGKNGRTAIAWVQMELDGLEAAPLAQMVVGTSWSWRGREISMGDMHAMFAEQTVQSAGAARAQRIQAAVAEDAYVVGAIVEISNGAQRFVAELAWIEAEDLPVLIFETGCPARDTEFWISSVSEEPSTADRVQHDDDTVVAFPRLRLTPEMEQDIAQPLVLQAAE